MSKWLQTVTHWLTAYWIDLCGRKQGIDEENIQLPTVEQCDHQSKGTCPKHRWQGWRILRFLYTDMTVCTVSAGQRRTSHKGLCPVGSFGAYMQTVLHCLPSAPLDWLPLIILDRGAVLGSAEWSQTTRAQHLLAQTQISQHTDTWQINLPACCCVHGCSRQRAH